MSEREVCPTCERPLPKEKSDAPVRRNKRFSVAVPQGEDPQILDDLLSQVVEKYWGEEGFLEVGAQGWRYPPLLWALYSAVASGPAEEGA